MIWLAWRQFRIPAAAVFTGLAALAVLLALTGPGIAHAWATGLAACTGSSGGCDNFIQKFFEDHQNAFLALTALVLLLPALLGLFWGAPMVAREVEAGTHRLVWNQSVTRTRWLLVKLGLAGLAAMAAGGLACLAVSWWSATLDSSAAVSQFPRLSVLVFDTRGVVPAAYAAFAFALGVAVGTVVRRALPAMAITLAAFAAVQIAVPALVRPHLLPPTRATVEISPAVLDGLTRAPGGPISIQAKAPEPGGWLLSSRTIDASGHTVDSIAVPAGTCRPPDPSGQGAAAADHQFLQSCLADINRLGYREQVSYHAPSRFWPFQWIESGLFTVAALALSGFSLWWLRRRLA